MEDTNTGKWGQANYRKFALKELLWSRILSKQTIHTIIRRIMVNFKQLIST